MFPTALPLPAITACKAWSTSSTANAICANPHLVRSRQVAPYQLIVAKNLKCGTIIAIAGQTQMNACKVRIRKRGKAVEPYAGHIAFRARGFASKHFAIESNQSFPVSCNQICVNVAWLGLALFPP